MGKKKENEISKINYFSEVRGFFSTLFLSVNKWEEGLIEKSIDAGMLLSKRTGMYCIDGSDEMEKKRGK